MEDCYMNGQAGVSPSEQAVQNIVSFVRCCQTVEAGGMKMRIFLN